MSEPLTSEMLPVVYQFTVEEVSLRLSAFAGIDVATSAGYKTAVRALAVCRSLRGDIEAKRKALKAGALEYGRRVDSAAEELTAAVERVEKPLKAEKQAVDVEKERLKREAAAAKQRALEEQIRQQREEEEARARAERAAALDLKVSVALAHPLDEWIAGLDSGHAEYVVGSGECTLSIGAEERAHPLVIEREREANQARRERREAEERRLAQQRAELEAERQRLAAEQARLDAERKAREAEACRAREAEEARIAAERARLDAERKAAEEAARKEQERVAAEQRAERLRLEAERHALEEQRRLAELAEAERRAKIRAEQEAAEQAERDRVAAEEARVREAERQAALVKRLEALRPERERALAYVAELLGVVQPELLDQELSAIVDTLIEMIREAREQIEGVATGEVAA